MTGPEILKETISIIERHVPVHLRSQIKSDLFIFDGSLDSLGVLNVISDLEQKFAIKFSDDDLQEEKIQTPTHITRVVTELLTQRDKSGVLH